eukprot:605414-Hanusia_phi.AAC.1
MSSCRAQESCRLAELCMLPIEYVYVPPEESANFLEKKLSQLVKCRNSDTQTVIATNISSRTSSRTEAVNPTLASGGPLRATQAVPTLPRA